ncbi:MarR family winged helix-turn-helix transcriptional regulator [Oharaeibacter diazotrophicus]|uniref:DNA-binding MarR family transcriptional regulator n=1 Tax=Oharaeibacter diazotrophicus TaxID=1920512 RepID=A0A4R6R9K5_9HYPH|nr:MarR family winged helix-turn-helix transcriptional regulator [Oharaeibacter diazotrophicus]TDP82751.1 DNA-binding MarR family transcriptional regulator [Oharaeibacter diazotrophicus]BBE72487.1 MarR family protein [Pleomorphomonas sp. SM30]GLS76518.1 hypothetical protein GCM10007904_18550 [Oharaeibacter diazotrophicus]
MPTLPDTDPLARPTPATAAALNVVAGLVPSLARRLAAAGARDHADDRPTAATLRLLERLYGTAGQSVPALARAMGTSRQFVQRVVDDAVARDLVARAPNPAHRRSPLMRLTERGRQAVEAVLSSETAVLAAAARGLSADDVEAAVRVLEALTAAYGAPPAGRQDR